jgi:dCTP deaminase
MLSGLRIKEEISKGNIIFEPFNEAQLNPNSYNIKLADELLIYDPAYFPLDPKKDNPTIPLKIPEEGLVLQPGVLYLGRTDELSGTYNFFPGIDGRSSTGRLGIAIHITAGYGDDGFCGFWTMEITVIHPTIVYPGMEIGQIYFQPIERASDEVSDRSKGYHGKYQNNKGIQPSMMWKDFQKGKLNERKDQSNSG